DAVRRRRQRPHARVQGVPGERREDVMEQPQAIRSPWAARRRRAERLRERYPFAAEVLTLYLELLDVQEPAFEAAHGLPPESAAARARELLRGVIDVTVAGGPAKLGESAVARYHSADLDDLLGRWLRDAEQSLVDRYLARATWSPLLEAMEPPALAALCAADGRARSRCP